MKLVINTRHQEELVIEFVFVTSQKVKVKVSASNINLTPIVVEYIGLNLLSHFTTYGNIHCLGEIESISTSSSGFILEGGIGCIKITAGNVSIEAI